MTEMPGEREITKQQLWQRDEAFREAGIVDFKDIHSRLDDFATKMAALVNKRLDQEQKALSDLRDQLFADAAEIRGVLLTDHKDQLAAQKALDAKRDVVLDEKLRSFRIGTMADIKKEVTDQFVELVRQVKNLNAKVDQYQKEIKSGVSKSQAEMADQVKAILGKVNELEAKLKGLSGLFK